MPAAITLHNIDDDLYAALRENAERAGVSLNRAAKALLDGALGLGVGEGAERGELRGRAGVRRAVALRGGHEREDLGGRAGVADAPAGHREGLRAAVHGDGARAELGRERGDRGERLVRVDQIGRAHV